MKSRTFDTRRQAVAWHAREKAALDGVLAPAAGKRQVKRVIPDFLEYRRGRVAETTLLNDASMLAQLAPGFAALHVGAVTARDVEAELARYAQGRAHSSVVRLRAVLAALFTWLVRERYLGASPMAGVEMPGRSGVLPPEMKPVSSLAELDHVVANFAKHDPTLAGVVRVLARTGLRWGELRALQVQDLDLNAPVPVIRVRRSWPEAARAPKSPKGGRGRVVPVAADIEDVLRLHLEGKRPGELVFPHLWRGRFLARLRWHEVAPGMRIHDLRHAAAILWLVAGIDIASVRAWMGHSSLTVTSRYTDFINPISTAAVALLNAGGTRGVRDD